MCGEKIRCTVDDVSKGSGGGERRAPPTESGVSWRGDEIPRRTVQRPAASLCGSRGGGPTRADTTTLRPVRARDGGLCSGGRAREQGFLAGKYGHREPRLAIDHSCEYRARDQWLPRNRLRWARRNSNAQPSSRFFVSTRDRRFQVVFYSLSRRITANFYRFTMHVRHYRNPPFFRPKRCIEIKSRNARHWKRGVLVLINLQQD